MERKALQKMEEWKNSSHRKPLVLKGARQVGKTWLMKEFGRRKYKKTFYFSFDKEESLHEIFKVNKEPHRIIEILGTIRGDKILPEKPIPPVGGMEDVPFRHEPPAEVNPLQANGVRAIHNAFFMNLQH